MDTTVEQGSEAWLAARRKGIGGSDISVIAGLNPYRSAYELYLDKRGEAPDQEPTEAMAWGHLLEPVIAKAYETRTGRKVRRVRSIVYHPRYRWAFASLDRVVVGEPRIVECKSSRSPRWSAEELPGEVETQVQWQLGVRGWDVADVAVLLNGSELRIVEVEFDRRLFEDLFALAHDFMAHVWSGVPPEIDGSDMTRQAIVRRYPNDDGQFLQATPQIDELVRRWKDARAERDAATANDAAYANEVRLWLGESVGVKGDGYRITNKAYPPEVKTDWEAVAKSLADKVDPGTVAQLVVEHSQTKPGTRRLTPYFGGHE